MKNVFNEGSKLFKNSNARKTDFGAFMKDINNMHKDPLVADLMGAVSESEFNELYSITPGSTLSEAQAEAEQKENDRKRYQGFIAEGDYGFNLY